MDILAEHMRSELESERIRQRVFEDEFLFDRIVEAPPLAEGSGGLEFERPVALLAHVRSLEEAEQALGVERIKRTSGCPAVVDPSSSAAAKEGARIASATPDSGACGADASGEPLTSFPSCPLPPFGFPFGQRGSRGLASSPRPDVAAQCDISADSDRWRNEVKAYPPNRSSQTFEWSKAPATMRLDIAP